ncbi:MAG: glycoside hydrolase family 57 protein [Candidatus Aenigmatarchaeota archaeon]
MSSIVLCFEVHQPFRIKHLSELNRCLDAENFEHFLNDGLNKFIFDRAARKCYLPTTKILLESIDTFKNEKRKFKFSINFSGLWLEQCEKWQPDLLENVKQLAQSGLVEFLGSTYFHSLASLFKSHDEFREQVQMQSQAIQDYFGIKPKNFVNTEMLYNNLIAKTVEDLGFKSIFTEGADRILGWRSPNYVYARGPVCENDKTLDKRIRVLTRNYRLSDDIGYRFYSKEWNEWPLTAEKYSIWLSSTPGQYINLFMDFETFGEHQPEESGIFFFLKALPWKIFDWKNLDFKLPSEIITEFKPVGEIDVHENNTLSWADMERDKSAWLGNSMQQMAFEELEQLESLVKQNGKTYLRFWRLLQQSDHFYYMCTKWWADGDVHRYFSPFSTPHDSFISMISGISDVKFKLGKELGKFEVLNGNRLKKVSRGKGKPHKNKEIEDLMKMKEPVKPKLEEIKPQSEIDFILNEKIAYPSTNIDVGKLERINSKK